MVSLPDSTPATVCSIGKFAISPAPLESIRARRARGAVLRLVALVLILVLAPGCLSLEQAFGGAPPPTPLSLREIVALNDNASVASEAARVIAIQNASARVGQGSWKSPSLVTLSDANGTELSFLLDSDDKAQHRKQLGVPTLGMLVQVQGIVHRNATNVPLLKPTFRWESIEHEGPEVDAADVAAGRVAEGSYVWLRDAVVTRARHEADGDWHVELSFPGGRLIVEETPPFADHFPVPQVGDHVTPFGMVLDDKTHGWWEIHPVHCWSRERCAPGLVALGGLGGGED